MAITSDRFASEKEDHPPSYDDTLPASEQTRYTDESVTDLESIRVSVLQDEGSDDTDEKMKLKAEGEVNMGRPEPARYVLSASQERTRKVRSMMISLALALVIALGLYCTSQRSKSHAVLPSRPADPPPYNDNAEVPVAPPESASKYPRRIRVYDPSGRITGTYPLYDEVDLSTASGSIDVVIVLQPPSTNNESYTPAILKIGSMSGSIRVTIKPPPSYDSEDEASLASYRNFTTHISTHSGSIHGSIVHSQSTTLSTSSGLIHTTILPYHLSSSSSPSSLYTSSSSGRTEILVASPIVSNKGPHSLTNLHAHHKSVGSGSIKLTYPHEWQGKVVADVRGSGSVHMDGVGLDVWREGYGRWVGERGGDENGSTVDIEGWGSGRVEFHAK